MWKLPVSWDGVRSDFWSTQGFSVSEEVGEVKLVIGLYKGEDVSEI